MSATRADFALLLESPDPVEAELAKELLTSAGIPSMLHGQDRDLAELGAAIHGGVARPDLLVPKTALSRAREVLRESWDEGTLTDEVALAFPVAEEGASTSGPRPIAAAVFAVFLVLALAVVLARSLVE